VLNAIIAKNSLDIGHSGIEPFKAHLLENGPGCIIDVTLFIQQSKLQSWLVDLPDKIFIDLSQVAVGLKSLLSLLQELVILIKLK
jgi:hypothetical protein